MGDFRRRRRFFFFVRSPDWNRWTFPYLRRWSSVLRIRPERQVALIIIYLSTTPVQLIYVRCRGAGRKARSQYLDRNFSFFFSFSNFDGINTSPTPALRYTRVYIYTHTHIYIHTVRIFQNRRACKRRKNTFLYII